jgi:hypothetical protein
MKRNTWWAKTLRIVGIVFMSLTAAFTIFGGIGTSCVALDPAGYGPAFMKLADYQWLYILYVIVTTAVGIMGVRAVVLLIKGKSNAYRYSLIAMILGILIGGIHMATSRALRGSSMPVDAVVYTTVLTLIIFLLFRIPGIWEGVNFSKPYPDKKTGKNAAAIALGLSGLLTLTIQFFMAPTHTIGGINYADAWHTVMTIIGLGLAASGSAMILQEKITITRKSGVKVEI